MLMDMNTIEWDYSERGAMTKDPSPSPLLICTHFLLQKHVLVRQTLLADNAFWASVGLFSPATSSGADSDASCETAPRPCLE